MDLVAALNADTGTTCVVGAGGKKTTLAALAARLEQSVVTATVRIPIFDDWVGEVVVTDDPVDVARERLAADANRSVGAAAGGWPLGLVPEREREDRYRGYETDVVDALGELDVPVLVKADGARMRRFKAPAEKEPQLPRTADTVVSIASVHAVGEPLSESLVHRVEEVSALTGLEPGETIRPADVAEVLASDRGGLKDVPDAATAIPLLNMVDDADLEATARAVAREIHERADVPRVVLAEMRAADPIVDVV
jgi:probable selenium-dependent hydroxylase accessory protein YqeC